MGMLAEPSNAPDPRGRSFEEQIGARLAALCRAHPTHTAFTQQPTLELQNGETVRPDFRLIVELPYERSHYFIECQDRVKYSKDLLHKIQHIRAKQALKTFVFVYPTQVPEAIVHAMKQEGIMHYSLSEFEGFVNALAASLAALAPVARQPVLQDRSMLASASSGPKVNTLPFPWPR